MPDFLPFSVIFPIESVFAACSNSANNIEFQ